MRRHELVAERARQHASADPRMVRTYMGVNIHPCASNSSGMRYWAMIDCMTMRADTLVGIKQLIKGARKVCHG